MIKKNLPKKVCSFGLIFLLFISSMGPAVADVSIFSKRVNHPIRTGASGAGTYITEDDSSIKIGNALLEISFDKTNGGGIDTVLDKQTGLDLRSDKSGPPLLYLIYFWNGTAVEGALQWNAFDTHYEGKSTQEYSMITIQHTHLKGYDLQTTTTVVLYEQARTAQFRLSIINNENFVLQYTYFPFIWGLGPIGSDATDDTIFYPSGDGFLLHNPLSEIENLIFTGNTYPGSASMQLMCYYDVNETGLYMATYDSEGHPKTLNYGTLGWEGEQQLAMAFQLLFPEYIGNDFNMDYDAVIGTFNGDWYEAATLYKSWAETSPFVSGGKVYEGKDIPDWFSNSTIIQLVNRDNPNIEVLSLSDIAQITKEYSDYTGMNTSVLIIGWEQNGAWVGPNYYPPVEGESAFQAAMTTLKKEGNHGFTYISGSAWRITREDIGYADYDLFNSTGLPWTALTADGSPLFDAFYSSIGWHTARMDPMTVFWHDMVVNNALKSIRLGVDVVQIDEFPIGTMYPCYNGSHGHQVGYSNDISKAYQSILYDIRQQGRAMNPDFVLSIEEPCEFYLPYIDTYVSRDSAPEALLYMGIIDRFGTKAEFIPFFSYVYHEYVTAFGESTSMDIDYAVGFYNQMARSLARTFIQGEIVKGAGTTSDKRHPEIFELYKHTARAATSYAKSYVIEGMPLAPPHINVPIRQIDWYNALSNEFGTPIFEPAVLHSAWLSDDDALGFAFVNWDTETIEFDVELPQYNGFLDTYSILMTCNGQKTILSYNVTLPYSLHISMEQNDVLLIEVIHSTENLKPNKPILAGPPTGRINTEYTYIINATDPDNDTISYFVDWGDGTVTGWLGPYYSGTPISEPHTWQQTGSYAIKAKSKDVHGLESDWSDPLPVNMPLKTNTLWMIFLEFLHLFLFSIFNTSL